MGAMIELVDDTLLGRVVFAAGALARVADEVAAAKALSARPAANENRDARAA